MTQPPGTPRTIGRKVTELLSATEQIRGIKSELRHLLFDDERTANSTSEPVRTTPSSSVCAANEAWNGGKTPTNPGKGILKTTTPRLVNHEESVDFGHCSTHGDGEITFAISSSESEESDWESDVEIEVSETEKALRTIYLSGTGGLCKYSDVIKEAKALMMSKYYKKIKGKNEYIFVCPRPQCTFQGQKWSDISDHYVKVHFESFQGKPIQPLSCPTHRCEEKFAQLMGLFSHVARYHPSKMGAVLTFYEENGIIQSE